MSQRPGGTGGLVHPRGHRCHLRVVSLSTVISTCPEESVLTGDVGVTEVPVSVMEKSTSKLTFTPGSGPSSHEAPSGPFWLASAVASVPHSSPVKVAVNLWEAPISLVESSSRARS